MPSSVTVNMRTCDRVHRITVSMRDDGDLDVDIDTDCENVREYARRLGTITMDDVTDVCRSKVNREDVRWPLTGTCLVPMGVIYAAWMECGMLSKNLCNRVHADEIIVDGNGPKQS